MRRALLTVSRDVYSRHYEELSDDEREYLKELIALQMLENEELKELQR